MSAVSMGGQQAIGECADGYITAAQARAAEGERFAFWTTSAKRPADALIERLCYDADTFTTCDNRL